MNKFLIIVFLCVYSTLVSSQENTELLKSLNDQLTEAIISDGFNPPAASRIYAYANIAAYEALAEIQNNPFRLGNKLNELPIISISSKKGLDKDLLFSAVFCETSKHLVYRTHILDYFYQGYKKSRIQNGLSLAEAEETEKQAKLFVEEFKKWIANDKYNLVKEAKRYEPFKGPQFWEPTPPAYMDALEPNWKLLRPLCLKAANDIVPEPPVPFDTLPNSAFYKQALDVKNATLDSVEEKTIKGKFWDCNPMQTKVIGHLSFVSRQLSPGGHWISIALIACQAKKLSLAEASKTVALTAVSVFDAFIVTWNEKYTSCLIRPETYINKYIDKAWTPLLETPPFPEHISGHSTISAAAATVLTFLLGDNFSYTDNSETPFGLGERKFSSFNAAADEASISRFYGGIHFMKALTEGQKVGKKVGEKLILLAK